jgi:hypothetical protein
MQQQYSIRVPQHKFFPTTSIAFGKVGTGKTVKSREQAEHYYGQGFCVIYLYDWGRFEAPFMNFPNPYKNMWDRYKFFFRIFNGEELKVEYKPRGYNTNCYIPFVSTMPAELPACFRPFRIRFDSLTFSEFSILLGSDVAKGGRDVLEIVWNEKQSSWTFGKFITELIQYSARGKMIIEIEDEEIEASVGEMRSISGLVRTLQNLWQSGLLCDADDPYALDMDAIMRDNKTVHSFSMAFMNDIETSYLIYAFLLRKIRELRQRDASRYPNLFLIINEAHELLPSDIEHSGQSQSLYYGKLLLSQPRDVRVWCFLDTQRFIRLNKTIRGSSYTYYVFKSDMAEIEEIGMRYGFSRSVQAAIKNLDTGVCCTVTDRIDVPCFFPPPRSMCKSYADDFFKWWKKFKLPMIKHEFKVPKRLFEIKRMPQGMDPRDMKIAEKELIKFFLFCKYKMETTKKPTTMEDFLKTSFLDRSYFTKFIRSQELYPYYIREDTVDPNESSTWLFYPNDVPMPERKGRKKSMKDLLDVDAEAVDE